MPVYLITVSHLGFVIASQAVSASEGFGMAAIIGELCGNAFVICVITEMELGGDCAIEQDFIKSLTL
jgi:hypothetical protein